MPFINVRWTDNTKDLKRNLREGVDQIEVTRASVDKLTKSLSGENVVNAAHRYAAAVAEIGGASNLTAANQARVNAVMTKAVEILEAAGKGGTLLAQHFRELADQTKKVDSAQTGWLSTLHAMGSSFVARVAEGVLLRDVIRGVIGVIHDSTIGLAEQLASLAVHGAAVSDVADNYKRLTTQAGLLGAQLLGTLRAGTHNTIGDFELMKTVNQDLAAGLKLTDQQFGTLAKGAFALAQATGVDVKNALETMNDAMLTGRTRSLALLVGKIDLSKAEEGFAKTLLSTAEHLTEEGKLEAARAEILKVVGLATERLGEQTDGLDEKVQQAQVAWENFKDELGKTLATSDVLATGLDGLKQIVIDTFGGRQQTLIEAISNAIESAEIAVIHFGQSGVQAGAFIAKEFIALEKIIGDVQQLFSATHLIALRAQRAVLEGTVGEKSSTEIAALNANAVALNETIAIIKGRGAALKQLDQDQKDIDTSTLALTTRLKELEVKMKAVRDSTYEARQAAAGFIGPLQDEAAAHERAGNATDDHTKVLQQSAAEKAKARAEAEKLAKAEELVAFATGGLGKVLATIDPLIAAEVQGFMRAGQWLDAMAPKFKLNEEQVRALSVQLAVETKWLELVTSATEKFGKVQDSLNKPVEADLHARTDAIGKMLVAASAAETTFARKVSDLSTSTADLQIRDLKRAEEAEIRSLGVRAAGFEKTYDDAADQIRRFYKEQVAIANGTSTSVVAITHSLGLQTETELRKNVAKFKHEYETLRDSGTATWEAIDAARKRYEDALAKSDAGAAFKQGLEKSLKGIPDLFIKAFLGGGGLKGALSALGVELGQVFSDALAKSIKQSIRGVQLPEGEEGPIQQGSGVTGTGILASGGIGAFAGIGAEAAGATGKQAAGAVGLSAASVATTAAILTGKFATAAVFGAATAGVGLGVVAAIELYKAKHMAQWEKLGADIGRDFGVSLSKETLKAWEKESKVFGRQATELLHLDEIIAAAGGIAKFGFDKAAEGAFDLFSLMKQGKLTVSQVTTELDKLWPSLVKGGTDAYGRISDKLKELIRLNAEYKTGSEAIAAFLKEQTSNLGGGVNATVEALGTTDVIDNKTTFESIGKEVTDAKAAVDALNKAGKQGTQEWKDAVQKLTDAQAHQTAAAARNKDTLDDLASQALTAYAAAVAAGATPAEALAAVAPALKTLRESYKDLGLDIEDAGVKALLMQDAILNGTGKLGAGIAGLNAQFVALDNLGLLNQDTFNSLERTGTRMFDRLKAAAIENGDSIEDANKDALIPMQQFLHEAEDAAKKYGFKLDDATQAMIDLSKATGIWKDKDPTDTIEGGIKDLIKAVKELINTLRGIPNEIPDPTRNWKLPTPPGKPEGGGEKDEGGSDSGRERAASGGIVRSWGIQHFREGGLVKPAAAYFATGGAVSSTFGSAQGTDIVPAWLSVGELILNKPQQQDVSIMLERGVQMAKVLATATDFGVKDLILALRDLTAVLRDVTFPQPAPWPVPKEPSPLPFPWPDFPGINTTWPLPSGGMAHFSSGGVIGTTSPSMHSSTDTVRAWLTPGEAILPKSIVQSLGRPTVEALIAGRLPLTPLGITPLTPIAAKPLTPIAATPITSIGMTPITPIAAKPLTPIAAAPIAPIASRPITSIGTSPLTPIASTPLAPLASTPIAPIATTPLTSIGSMFSWISALAGPRGTDTVPAWLTPGEAVLPTDSVDALGSDLVRQLIESGRTSSYFAQGGIVHELPSIRNLLPSSLTPDAISPQEQRLSEILHVGSTMPNELLMNASKAIGASVSSPTTVTIDARGALLDSYGMRQLAKKLQDEGGFWTHVGHNSNGEYTKARAAMNLPV